MEEHEHENDYLDDGGSAFPRTNNDDELPRGLTIRDWFAGRALAALIARPDRDPSVVHARYTAEAAYDYAAAMIDVKREYETTAAEIEIERERATIAARRSGQP